MRVLLVLMLMLSQAIAPALHAHVGGEHYGDGAHLHNPFLHGHAATAGAEIESIEGRVVGVALSLVSRAARIAAPRPGDADAAPGLALPANTAGITLPLRAAGPVPTTEFSIQTHTKAPYLLPQRRGPPLA
jgi:hypothetical protein